MSCRVLLQTYLTAAISCDGEGDIPLCMPDLLVSSAVPFFAVLDCLLGSRLLLPPGQYALYMSKCVISHLERHIPQYLGAAGVTNRRP